MANVITPDIDKMTDTEIDPNAVVSTPLKTKIGANINAILDAALPIGSIIHSALSVVQFQSQIVIGSWALADGSTCEGTRYEELTGNATVPDLRGMFLRGKNNGRSDGSENPDGDLAIGQYQDSEVYTHNHTMTTVYAYGSNSYSPSEQTSVAVSGSKASSSSGGAESRPKNLTTNIFIRVN